MDHNEERLRILANSNVSRGKFAAAAVHAALNHYGIDHGAVIVLGSKGIEIEERCTSVIRDAGRTECLPGTVTAGVLTHEGRPNCNEGENAKFRAWQERTERSRGITEYLIDAWGDLNDPIKAMLSVDLTDGYHDPTGGDGYIPGTWDLVMHALMDGVITDDEYEILAKGFRGEPEEDKDSE